MRTLSLAWRNLLRNRRRSATTLVAMIVGLVTILTFGGYTRNITYSLQTGYVMRSGHLQVQRSGYFLYGSGNPGAYGIADYRKIIDVVSRDPVLSPMIAVVTPTLSLGGIAGNAAAGVSHTVLGTGVVVDDHNRMRRWDEYGLPFRAPPSALTGTTPDAVVLGGGVARVLQLCDSLGMADCPRHPPAAAPAAAERMPDDILALASQEAPVIAKNGPPRVELLVANVHGAPNVASLRVVDVEPQGFKEFDDVYVGLHLAQAQRLLYGGGPPRATAVVVQLRHSRDLPVARTRLQDLLASALPDERLDVLDFETLNPFYRQAVGMFAAIFGFMSVLIGSIVLFTVTNTMSTAVMERTAEIGTLRAIGLRRSGIRRLFVCEALLLGIAGSIAGTLAGLGASWLINQAGLTWLPPGQVDPVPLTVRVWGEGPMIVSAAVGLIVVAAISAWWPARRAGRMVIVDALRHVG